MEKPEVITMCGSTRYGDLMACISWELEKTGIIIMRVNYLPSWYGKKQGYTEQDAHYADQEGLKDILDTLHFRKIDMSDKVVVCNFDNYIGHSTRNEIEYAISVGKPIVYLYGHREQNPWYEVTEKLARWWTDADYA